ncbi:solute carrier family protein (macronuclear) [Tetrahymena thermophila SB210]|uniref:Solute carrier family protein n=1 Tax=Tetrahymena thermophila (strain SB210) TaxID=312017 RepID=Q22V58_TETTS|nr:solute carrier family protein [Tetrahymena thermophila SB210]EAR89090.2 solute carrier family protein [Tetrahymena thermophila SB210]|eukprot:XP_001009335.2 solute carrier family protein [Tetrahymena thermophila SB210]
MSKNQGAIQLETSEKIQSKNEHKQLKSFLSGGIAGACGKTVIAPFERVKLLFVTRDRTLTYREFYNEGKFIIQKHGFRNLWRGNSANLLRIFPFASINFSTFDYLRKNVYYPYPSENKIKKQLLLFCIGAVSGIVSQSICYPFEFIRTRLAMQRDNFHYKNFVHAVKVVYNQEGIKGFYSGLGLAIVGVIFYHGSGFFMMTNLKNYAKENHIQRANKWYMDFIFGAIGATISQMIAYPFDVMRKRRQAQSLLISTGEQTHKMTYRQLVTHYIKKEGYIPTFYKGITINLVKAPLSSGTAWMVKNQLNRFLDKSYDL